MQRPSSNGALADLLDEPRLSEETGVALTVGKIAEPVLRALGYRLVRVRLSGQDGTTLQIMAERPDGSMDVESCGAINDTLSPVLDVEDPIKGEYRLEISSPGIDRPLMRVSDFRRAVGFEAKIEMHAPIESRRRFRGLIEAVEESGPDPVLAMTRFDAKPGEPEALRLSLRDIADGRLVLTDDLVRAALRASKGASAVGAEGEETEAPSRGPGRFALRNASRRKARPLMPAGFKPTRARGAD